MQRDQQFCPNKAGFYTANQPLDTHMQAPIAPSFGAKHLASFHGLEFHPSEVCPKNFIIFDQTDNRSQIMFHPGIAQKFNAPSFNFHDPCIGANSKRDVANTDESESSYPLEEDQDDIDALLLSSDDEEEDEEEVSTARTYGNYGSMSPDSFSDYDSKLGNDMASSSSSSYNYERKREKMRKMVKALRGIVPGADQMNNSVAVIDEAVRYLKFLKVDAQKLGVRNLKD